MSPFINVEPGAIRWCALCNRCIDGVVLSLHIEDILIPLSEEIARMHAGNASMADALSG